MNDNEAIGVLHLPSGSASSYEWLTHILYLGDASPISLNRILELNMTRELPSEVLSVISEHLEDGLFKEVSMPGPAKNWASVEEAVDDLTTRHEFCHFIQDSTTGVGHWDEVIFRKECLELISRYSAAQDWSGVEEVREDFDVRAFAQFLVFAPVSVEKARKSERIKFLANHDIATLTSAGADRYFGIANLLETDAVAENLIHVTEVMIHNHDDAVSILNHDSVRHLWNPSEMPTSYVEHFNAWRSVFAPEATRATDPDFILRSLNTSGRILQQLTDIALAYPPPSFMQSISEDRKLFFDPVVKYYCLLSAFYQMGFDAG